MYEPKNNSFRTKASAYLLPVLNYVEKIKLKSKYQNGIYGGNVQKLHNLDKFDDKFRRFASNFRKILKPRPFFLKLSGYLYLMITYKEKMEQHVNGTNYAIFKLKIRKIHKFRKSEKS